MKSIIVLQNGVYIRLIRGERTRERDFEMLVNNSACFGVTGWYSDRQDHFEGMFKVPPVKWDEMEERIVDVER